MYLTMIKEQGCGFVCLIILIQINNKQEKDSDPSGDVTLTGG
jgi:hypothetical protein